MSSPTEPRRRAVECIHNRRRGILIIQVYAPSGARYGFLILTEPHYVIADVSYQVSWPFGGHLGVYYPQGIGDGYYDGTRLHLTTPSDAPADFLDVLNAALQGSGIAAILTEHAPITGPTVLSDRATHT